MRVLAGSVVVFAGAFLFAVSALAEALPAPGAGGRSAAPGWGYFLGCVLACFGIYMIVRAWPWDGGGPAAGRPPSGEPGRERDRAD